SWRSRQRPEALRSATSAPSQTQPPSHPLRAEGIAMDATVVAFATALMLLSGLFAGMLAAMSSRNERILETLQESSRAHGGRSKARLRKVLLAMEMSLTVVLLIGAGLLVKSYSVLRNTDLGCATRDVLTMRLALPGEKYQTAQQRANFYERLIEE